MRNHFTGPALPQALHNPGYLPFRDTFYILGGFDRGRNKDEIYKYDPESHSWILQPFKLSRPDSVVKVMIVKRSAFGKIEQLKLKGEINIEILNVS